MSTSIRVSDETKEKLARLKREDESWDKFLDLLATEESENTPVGTVRNGTNEPVPGAVRLLPLRVNTN